MSLAAGTRLGPYAIDAPLGAGGMGEVYRARDERLGREVAVKVLPAALAGDDHRRRFEQEARAAARLNHPNILQVHDVGEHDGHPYVVTELLEGETLRERLSGGPLPVRKAVEIGIAVARGLAAAHDQGVVHRDLKPENLFVTGDGRVKILDFGLAKLAREDGGEPGATSAPTLPADTAAGLVMGTVGYMSPEQVRGQPVDHRSDLFALGAVLHEMLSGRRAFRGESPADTMSAILREDPPELGERGVPPMLERIVRHCLEKSPAQRFRSAHDLAFQLEALSVASGTGLAVDDGPAPSPRASTRYHKLTFGQGFVHSARFADGETVLYSAAWEGEPARVYLKRPQTPEAIPLALPSAEVHAVSRGGEIALVLDPRWAHYGAWRGTLAVAPLFGGAPRAVEESILHADFGPDGALAVARDERGRGRLEFPIGRTLHECPGHVSCPRVAPDGRRVAFIDHPFPGDDRGRVAIADPEGRVRALTPVWGSVQGLAWSASGEEIWFTAAAQGTQRALHAVTPSGDARWIAAFPGSARLLDVSRDGSVLLAVDHHRVGTRCRPPGADLERELTWLDWTLLADLTPDGRTALLNEHGDGGGPRYRVCARGTDGSPVVQLGEGRAMAISPDGRWALAMLPDPGSPLQFLPTGAGRPRTVAAPGADLQIARWLPDGNRLVCAGSTPDQAGCAYVLHLSRGVFERLPLEGPARATGIAVDPGGSSAILTFAAGGAVRLPLDGSDPEPGPALDPDDRAFHADGDWLFVEGAAEVPRRVTRVHLRSGERRPWRALAPPEAGGVVLVGRTRIAAGGEAHGYFYARVLSDLFLVTGLE